VNNQASVADIKSQCQQWLQAGQLAIAHAEVRAMRDYKTGQIEVRGQLCCAPDEHTILLYPIKIYRWGYWNKTEIRKQMSEVKRELISQMASEGYTVKMLVERKVEMCEIRF
jgi:hypothetical protein